MARARGDREPGRETAAVAPAGDRLAPAAAPLAPVAAPLAPAAPGRLWLLVACVLASVVLAKVTGVSEALDVERVRAFVEATGPWGFLTFVAIFALGELLHVPGLVFVGAAAIAYDELLAVLAAYAGALVSVTTSFVVVRTIGGQPLRSLRRPWLRTMLARLETRPVSTVALLRLLLWMAPPLNYGLAMTGVTLRHYVLGSALGLLVPIPLAVFCFDWIAGALL